MSTPTQSDASRTPATGTKRRYLGAARRRRTAENWGFPSPNDASNSNSKNEQCSNATDTDSLLHNKFPPTDRDESCDLETRKRPCRGDDVPDLATASTDVETAMLSPNSRGVESPGSYLLKEEVSLTLKRGNKNTDEAVEASSSGMSQSQRLQSTPVHRFPSRNSLSGSARKRFKHNDFKSPMRSQPDSPKPVDTAESLSKEVERLQESAKELESDIASLTNEGYCEEELRTHIDKMHEYNELKDTGQMLLGKIALIEGVTTKQLYARYELSLDD